MRGEDNCDSDVDGENKTPIKQHNVNQSQMRKYETVQSNPNTQQPQPGPALTSLRSIRDCTVHSGRVFVGVEPITTTRA